MTRTRDITVAFVIVALCALLQAYRHALFFQQPDPRQAAVNVSREATSPPNGVNHSHVTAHSRGSISARRTSSTIRHPVIPAAARLENQQGGVRRSRVNGVLHREVRIALVSHRDLAGRRQLRRLADQRRASLVAGLGAHP